MPRARSLTLRPQVYDFIVKFKQTHDGVSPSVAEICEGCEISSNSVVVGHLHSLERLGLIECGYGKGKSRMIAVCGGRWIPPSRIYKEISPIRRGARVPSFASLKS
jgi:hypothetical protein